MYTILSSLASLPLRPFVRAYAQREITTAAPVLQPVVASVEQILEFDFAAPPVIHYHDGRSEAAPSISVVGAHTSCRASLGFAGRVDSFAVFFHPLGLWRLLRIPNRELVNQAYDGVALVGADLHRLWHAMAETGDFSTRVAIVERYLLQRALAALPSTPAMAAATHIFRRRGMVRVGALAGRSALGLRQFERTFLADIGMHPKLFARITRFQMALDAKVTAPDRPWLGIAHEFGYHDQTHLIRDFQSLGMQPPGKLLASLGDGRPAALAASDDRPPGL